MTTSTAVANEALLSIAAQIRGFAERATDAYDVTIYAAGLAAMTGLVVTYPGEANGPLMGVARSVIIKPSDNGDSRQILVRINNVESRSVKVTVDLD